MVGTTMRLACLCVSLAAACTTPSGGGGGGSRPAPPAAADLSWLAQVAVPDWMERPSPELEREIGRRVVALFSENFADSSAAARRLIETGLPAVPYLGSAAAGRRDARARKVVCVVLDPILRSVAPEDLGRLLRSPYRAVRIVAAQVCGELGWEEHGPALVDLLEDPDPEVRRAAVAALRRLTNRFYGYRVDGRPEERARAVERWRKHWLSG